MRGSNAAPKISLDDLREQITCAVATVAARALRLKELMDEDERRA